MSLYINQELATLGAIYRLIDIKQYIAAATVLREYLANGIYNQKIHTMQHYFSHPDKKNIWMSYIKNVNVQDDHQRNLFDIFARGNYTSEDEVKEVLTLLDDLLEPMAPEIRTAMLNHPDKLKFTAIGDALFTNSQYSPYFIALYVKHGANVDLPQGPSQKLPLALARENLAQDFGQQKVEALEGKFNLDKFLPPKEKGMCIIC
ncbi:MAG: hypothetical protein ACK4PR_07055 [Gammaproteobacteria bacterium]